MDVAANWVVCVRPGGPRQGVAFLEGRGALYREIFFRDFPESQEIIGDKGIVETVEAPRLAGKRSCRVFNDSII